MATLPFLRTWTSGERLTGAKLNQIRDALQFLMDPPRAHIWADGGVSLADGSYTRLTMPDVEADTDAMAMSPGRMKFTTPGRYRINLFLALPTASYSSLSYNLRINSGGSQTGGNSIRTWVYGPNTAQTITMSLDHDFLAGDYIEPFVLQASGAARTTGGNPYGTACQATWIAP